MKFQQKQSIIIYISHCLNPKKMYIYITMDSVSVHCVPVELAWNSLSTTRNFVFFCFSVVNTDDLFYFVSHRRIKCTQKQRAFASAYEQLFNRSFSFTILLRAAVELPLLYFIRGITLKTFSVLYSSLHPSNKFVRCACHLKVVFLFLFLTQQTNKKNH